MNQNHSVENFATQNEILTIKLVNTVGFVYDYVKKKN